MDDPEHIAHAFPDKHLLDYLRSGEKNQGLREILDAFSKFSFKSSCLDHTTLRTLFVGLRECASTNSRWISSVIPHLANLYDNLLLRDLSQPEISVSICELLFFIEDVVDHGDCKIMAGQHFLGRLLILTGSKLTGIRLQRAAVETLSSLILMCPTNQRIVSEEFSFQWQKIVKQVLPQCGDFFVQASIVEILYRLSKKHVHLLDALEDRKLKEMIISLHKVKKPELHAQTRAFLDHLNGSLGLSRSVLSCLGEDIMCNGISTPLKCERWVHFAADHISLYAALNSESETSLLDVLYTKIKRFQLYSNNCIEMVVQGLLHKEESRNQVTTTKFVIVLKPEDLATVKDYVLPRIHHLRKQGSKNEPSNANTSITPHTSGDAHRFFRKASIGFGIPLPKKVRFPILSSISNAMPEDDFFKETHENESVSKHISEPSRKSNEKASNEEIQEENMNLNVQSSKEMIPQYNKNLTANGVTADSRDMISKEGNISKTVAKATECRISIPETQGPQRTVIGDKQQEMGPNLKPSSALLDTSMYVEPKPNRGGTSVCSITVEDSIKNALGFSPKSMKQELKHPGHLKLKNNSHLRLDEAPKYSNPRKCEPLFEPDAAGKANPGSAALQTSVIKSNVKVKDASVLVEKKIADSNQVDQWRAKILHILEDTSLNVPSREKKDNFISDPIESDSGHTTIVPVKSNPNGKRVPKTTYKPDKKRSLNSEKRQASSKNLKTETETEKDDRVVCTENAPEKDKDVFCFENDQQCKRSLCKPSADENQENHEFFNAIDADDLRTPFKPTVDDMEVPYSLKRSSCSTQGRKEEHSIQTGPVKKLRLSSNNIDSESLINPSPPSEKLLAFGDCITLPKSDGLLTINDCASTPRSDALFSFGCTNLTLEKEDKIHPLSTFSRENQTEKACDLKENNQRCFQSSSLPKGATYRSDGQYQKAQRRTKSRNEQMNFFLQEHLQIAKVDNDDDDDTNGEMQLFANTLQKIMNKDKVIRDRKSTEILASTKEKIMNRCKEAQAHIESDLNEYKKLSMERFGQLQLQLQDEYEAFKSSQKKWKDEMHTHLKHFKDISAQVETSESYLNSICDKQKIAHKKLYSKVNEFAEQYIKEAEQQLLTLQKAALESRNDLKKTILDIL